MQWTEWKSILIDVNVEEATELTYENSVSEFLISYGRDNRGQSYAGGTILILRYENKPVYLPVYVDKNQNVQGIVYIHNDHARNVIRLQSFLSVQVRFNISIR